MKSFRNSTGILTALFAGLGLGAGGRAHPSQPRISKRQAEAIATGIPVPLPTLGASPDVWGQSSACRRMVRKNFYARRARS